MNRTTNKITYEAPLIETIEVEVEKGFVESNIENPKEGETSNW
jgi:hypothetical protein